MTGEKPKQSIGKFDKKTSSPVRIVRMEAVDSKTGLPFDPPEYEYWLVTIGMTPKVLKTDYSFEKIFDWVLSHSDLVLV